VRGHHAGPRFGWADGPWAEWSDPRFADRLWGGNRRMRRGDVRGEVLTALLDGPAHGYEVIRRLEERSGGAWRPSPGSVYPTLQLLDDSGLVRSSEQDGRRTYELTDEGRTEAEQHAAKGQAGGPGDDTETQGRFGVRSAAVEVLKAAMQVAGVGTPDQVGRAIALLRQTRQSLYQILAED
jgi:DNA-binding PadR family transcriptional regulator